MRSEKSLNWGSFKLFPPFALQKAVISSICFTKSGDFLHLLYKSFCRFQKTVENKNKIEKAGKKLLFIYQKRERPARGSDHHFPTSEL